jgi:hypothetical protein
MPNFRRPRRAVLLGLCATAVAVAGSGAQASPYVGTFRGLDVHVTVDGADGSVYRLEIVATRSVAAVVGSEQSLYVDLTRCLARRCRSIEHSRRPLASADIDISPDMGTAALHTAARGIPITVSAAWNPVDVPGRSVSSPGIDVYSLESMSGGPNPRSDAFVIAIGTVRLGNLGCGSTPVTVYTFEGVDRVGDDVRDPRHGPVTLPAGMVRGTDRPHCY